MAKFPQNLKPVFVDDRDLVRLGSIDDGGYVVPIETVKSSNVLISVGISDNWDFEKDFLRKSSAYVYASDNSIDSNFWLSKFKKDSIKFLQLKIFKPKKIYKKPDEKEKKALIDLADKIEKISKNSPPEEIQTIVYTVGKENGYEKNLREWFKLLYQVLFGDIDGPRMGFFISFFGVHETVKLIKDKIN